MPAELQTERRDGTLVLAINDPGSYNALSAQVFTAGVESLNVAESDPSVRCIVLRGEGAHFCADVNLPLWHESPHATAEVRRHFHDFAEALRFFPKPVIAAVEGMACGDGFWLALACDLVVAAHNAKFVPFPTRMDMGPERRFPADLMHKLPRSQLLEWMWLTDPVPAEQLHRLGLLNRLAPPGQAFPMALEMARQLALRAPEALAQAKESVNVQAR